MLAYVANRPAIAARRPSPPTMLLIATAHVVAVAVLMSAKMDLPGKIFDPPFIVDTYKAPSDPPKPVERTRPTPATEYTPTLTDPQPRIPLPPLAGEPVVPDPGPRLGPAEPNPFPRIDPKPVLGRSGPVLITPESELRPPYPHQKLLTEEEASLTLRLSLDERGRVVAVDPVGRADPIFLAAARRHLLSHWRYRPAMADGHGVATTLITTLHFRIDG